jgi:hypothetical protein
MHFLLMGYITRYSKLSSKATSIQQPKLLDQMRKIRYKHYNKHTEASYVYWIRRYIFFHGNNHPCGMGARETGAFQQTHFQVQRS